MSVEITRNINNWLQLADQIEQHQSGGWIFRGVTDFDNHKLIPKIGRSQSRKDPTTGGHLPFDAGAELQMFAEFRRLARPYLPREDLQTLEVLAIAQHHGLPTRLLDWTTSPLVAAYFAVEAAGTEGTPAIYAIRDLEILRGDENPFELNQVSIYKPPHIATDSSSKFHFHGSFGSERRFLQASVLRGVEDPQGASNVLAKADSFILRNKQSLALSRSRWAC